ncbi:MAG TPA: hypothetical protein VNY84_01900 [Acidimicrobiales bacterium]|nr:hypothetical protein [Acidimicrobiales bacterium]
MADWPPGPDEPTEIYRPVSGPGSGGYAGPPTQAMPATGRPGGPGGPVGGDPVGGGAGPPRPNPWIIGLLALVAVLAIAIIVLLVVGRGGTKGSSAAGPSTPTSSTSSTSSTTNTTVVLTLPTLPTTTSTTPPTTAVVAPPGNRAPTAAEEQQILHDANPGPNAQIDQIRIANSDPTWSLIHVSPTAGHAQDFQAAYKILELSGGSWVQVSAGTAQVSCSSNIPPNIVADFANILGTCGSGQ